MDSRRPVNDWRQLNFRFFVCLPSAKCGCISFCILFWISLSFTIVLLSYSTKVLQHEVCSFPKTLHISEKMISPVFVYLKYSNYYQNYRQYAKSISMSQLHGKTEKYLDYYCDPIQHLDDLPYDGQIFNYQNTKLLKNSSKADPCGLVSASFINYTINLSDSSGMVEIHTKDIEWETYDSNKFKNDGTEQYLDKENKHFSVWVRTAATKDFLKLYGKIEHDVKGDLKVDLIRGKNFLKTKGKPCVLISTVNNMGGKNQVLGWTMFVCTVLSLAWVLAFVVMNKSIKPLKVEQVFFDQLKSG